MPGTGLGNRDSMGSETVHAPDLTELVFLAGEIDLVSNSHTDNHTAGTVINNLKER